MEIVGTGLVVFIFNRPSEVSFQANRDFLWRCFFSEVSVEPQVFEGAKGLELMMGWLRI